MRDGRVCVGERERGRRKRGSEGGAVCAGERERGRRKRDSEEWEKGIATI